jgi:hypothetical protein
MTQRLDRPPGRARHPAAALLGACLLAGLLAAAGPAQAQWEWRDARGNITYSDAPPPADVSPDSILRRPSAAPSGNSGTTLGDGGARPAGDAPAPGGAKAPAPAAAAPKSWAEQDAEFRKRREEQAKAEQKQAEEQAKEAQKREACNQARGYLDMVQNSGMRLMRPNPDGTRGYMDDDTRAAEVQKAQESVEKNCS